MCCKICCGGLKLTKLDLRFSDMVPFLLLHSEDIATCTLWNRENGIYQSPQDEELPVHVCACNIQSSRPSYDIHTCIIDIIVCVHTTRFLKSLACQKLVYISEIRPVWNADLEHTHKLAGVELKQM